MMRAHWVFVAGFLGVSLFADSLMKMVNSNIIFVNPKLWTVIGIAFFVERYGAMHMQLYSLTNKIVWHIANGITGIIYISFCLIFYKFLGVYTFPVGLLISYLCFYSWYASKKSYASFKLNFYKFETNVSLVPALVLIIVQIFFLVKIKQ